MVQFRECHSAKGIGVFLKAAFHLPGGSRAYRPLNTIAWSLGRNALLDRLGEWTVVS